MKSLNSNAACAFIISKGITMSKSKLYKLTSSYKIIFHRAGNRLLFYEEELEGWCVNQIETPQIHSYSASDQVIQSAQKSRKY